MKAFVCLLGGFAAYYAFFLASLSHELYGPDARLCGTAQVWALQGAALFFAPPALLGSVALSFVGKQKQMLGTVLMRIGNVSLAILTLCALVNLWVVR